MSGGIDALRDYIEKNEETKNKLIQCATALGEEIKRIYTEMNAIADLLIDDGHYKEDSTVVRMLRDPKKQLDDAGLPIGGSE